jgi:hypothetical protein
MKILFLHGWHSVPGGVKPTYLREHGCEVINPKLDDDDFEAALVTSQAVFDLHQPDCVVGSSRGGAAAMNIRSGATPLVLLCPAWKKWGTAKRLKNNAAILHSPQDEVIPFEDSQELILKSRLPMEVLMEVGEDHRLADESSLSVMLWACKQLVDSNGLPMFAIGSESEPSTICEVDVIVRESGSVQSECSYLCDACGEEIVITVDVTEGTNQEYVEDCPVCCRANIIHVEMDDDGGVRAWAEPEQD